jgi:hypothetical protein
MLPRLERLDVMRVTASINQLGQTVLLKRPIHLALSRPR